MVITILIQKRYCHSKASRPESKTKDAANPAESKEIKINVPHIWQGHASQIEQG